ncbi:hypothetical protein METBIDRAFT_33382 [Metschnikowia bicuspidata var. bicuspidata NRRL YB-4993]|uniref:Aminopeptidase P N-terminal domain-containing protein n=1 Tax=Metschnikowia bicuspidata var. bicuspidata NRRL YB-4993 TaxID=869754 RepID=A0A1A0H5J6_9ASCO|nr:hypothetical protein METBIDRAFT_33382 [Metschnikowia bicuspidata var. bicuspidata NRRL YB-4993]OBA19172.1 hypothetical protein METBIDRAFT_33382 [Metschnikowia bicuspidata var. bicuspidata NRRL YB-4993]
MYRIRWPLLRRYKSNLATRPPLAVPYKTGQPMHETRRHLIPQPGQLTPGISALEYYNRRLVLAQELPAKSAAILVGNQVQHSSGSVFYEFQQDNDLFYLTGWLSPDSVVVLEKVSDKGTDEDVVLHMFVPPKNAAADLWEGDKNGLEGAYDYFNADEVQDVNKVESSLRDIIKRNEFIYYDNKGKGSAGGLSAKFSLFFNLGSSPRHSSIKTLLDSSNKVVRPLQPILAQHRLVKSEAEVRVMHKAGQISGRAINTAIAKVGSDSAFSTEKTLAKYLEYAFVRGGCDLQAYIPVVASGENALTLHYTRNDDLLYRDETVFVDAGGKLGGYCADISRAWPNSPSGFSDPQKDIYNVVLSANKACIDQCHEDNGQSLQSLHELAVTTMVQGLRDLPGMASVTRTDVSRDLFPHYIGHHLGLDLHDVPSVSRMTRLVKGNVVTIEPGLYIPQNDKWPKHYQGIGVRVEDDIAVGKSSSDTRNLTSVCVKEVDDIEALIRRGEVTTPHAYDEAVDLEF